MGNIASYTYWTSPANSSANSGHSLVENVQILEDSGCKTENSLELEFPIELFDEMRSIVLKHVDTLPDKVTLFDQIKQGFKLRIIEKKVKKNIRDQLLESIKEQFISLNKVDSIKFTKLHHIESDPRENSKKNAIKRMKTSSELMVRMASQKIKIDNSIYDARTTSI